nr:MAG TPA: hypothetical protein [Caudoviricetes sp.]
MPLHCNHQRAALRDYYYNTNNPNYRLFNLFTYFLTISFSDDVSAKSIKSSTKLTRADIVISIPSIILSFESPSLYLIFPSS